MRMKKEDFDDALLALQGDYGDRKYSDAIQYMIYEKFKELDFASFQLVLNVVREKCRYYPKFQDFVEAYDEYRRREASLSRKNNTSNDENKCRWCGGTTLCPAYKKGTNEVYNFKCTCETAKPFHADIPKWDEYRFGKFYNRLRHDQMPPESKKSPEHD